MRHFLSALLITLLVACSTDSVPDEEEKSIYPITVGTWEVTSPDSANWIGELQDKFSGINLMQTDTIFADTSKITMTVTQHIEHEDIITINIHFDYAVTSDFFDYDKEPVINSENFIFGGGGALGSVNDPKAQYLFGYINCLGGETVYPADKLDVPIYPPDQDSTVYRFNVDGLLEATRHIQCGDSL